MLLGNSEDPLGALACMDACCKRARRPPVDMHKPADTMFVLDKAYKDPIVPAYVFVMSLASS